MKLIKRASWGARYGRGPTNITPQNGGVAVHYVGDGKLTGADHNKCAGRVRGIEDHHVNGNGWAAIAYNYLACHHGYVFEGRGLGHRSAAQGTNSGNQNYYAVCALIGAQDTPDDALKSALRDAIDYMRDHDAGSRIKGHKDFHSTSCPGAALYAWVGKGAPRPGGSTPTPEPEPPAGTAPKWPGRYITQPPAMSGQDVRTWQDKMSDRGWDIEVDGVYGPASEEVCLAFQDECNREGYAVGEVDGVIGPRTWDMTWRKPIT